MGANDPDFRLLFEVSPDVLLVLLPDSPRYTMVAATEARYRITHTTPEQTIGIGLFELFPDNPDDPGATGMSNLRASLERVLATRAADTMAVQKYDIRMPDGHFEARYWSPKNIPVLGPEGEVKYIFHRVEDVSELVRAAEQGEELKGRTLEMEREVLLRSGELAAANGRLREANAKLGALDKAKTAFFSNVSHEFRTPLTLMLGPLEDMLADRTAGLAPEMRKRIELVYGNTLRLLKLVNALLDFSRIEAARMQVHYAPLDLSQFTSELAGMFQSAVTKTGLGLVVDCPKLSELAWVDREMWEKIVPNLVSNAFKFTLAGEIAVRMREDPNSFVLEVADTGVGISEVELPRVFERFHRVEGALGRTHEGTGIGLSLVRELVELHGGNVSATSKVGQGSTFRVEIPKGSAHLPAESLSLERPARTAGRDALAHARESAMWTHALPTSPPPTASAARSPSASRPHVLVADDHPELREYIVGLLAPFYEVTAACDGEDALVKLTEKVPDLVVSDVMMPRLDGFGLVRAIRARSATASVPVVLLSARAGEESAVDGLDAGADDYLSKPFTARELLARVRTHVDLARARRTFVEELERANRELDAFSYSVSHDLRAPLRAIEGFSRILLEDSGPLLDEAGKGSLNRIVSSVQRMNKLIESLLELSRISRVSLATDFVDLSAVAQSIVSELRRAHPDRRVVVDIEDGLAVEGDLGLLHAVLTNLLENAWKFTSRREDAHIEFRRVASDVPTFVVRDNGAGFDMEYVTRLFAPFQRLHSMSEFEGTGVGLATVQRVMSRHHGRAWAEAVPQQGASFFLAFPSTAAVDR